MADGQAIIASIDVGAISAALRITKRSAERRATREAWPFSETAVRGGKKRIYALVSLPADVQAALSLQTERKQRAKTKAPAVVDHSAQVKAAWARYDIANPAMRKRAQDAAAALDAVQALVDQGERLMTARELVVVAMREDGVGSVGSLSRWAAQVRDIPRADWPAILLPAYVGGVAHATCDEQCWDWYKGHYLTRGQPSHRDTYRRLKEMADAQGWTIPSEATLRRRMDAEVPHSTQVIKREGVEAARKLLPTLIRDVLVFAAGEAVNGDGMKFDTMYVRFEDGEILNTATAWFWQDLRTRKILAWRLGKTENTDLFRLSTYDLTAVCSPAHVWIDNTRVAANKLMTAGAKGRHRFKADPEEGEGLLRMMGMEPHFTNPSKEHGNPGAKPIERAFGIGGLHEKVRTHPRLVALDCFRKANAVNADELRGVIAEEVARFNAQIARRTQACRGTLSFDQAWDESVAEQPVRVLSDSQRRLLLMCREVVTADRNNGELRIKAGRGPFGQNAYWCEQLTQYCGRKVVALYDPENLSAGVHVYSLEGRYLFGADHLARGAFNDTETGREHAKFRRRRAQLNKQMAANETRMDALERSALYETARPAPLPEAPAPADTTVVHGHFKRTPDPSRDAARRTGTDDVAREVSLDDFLKKQAESLKDRHF